MLRVSSKIFQDKFYTSFSTIASVSNIFSSRKEELGYDKQGSV